MRSKFLLASIHDVGPLFERQIDRLFELLTRRLGSSRLALLVVPDHWAQAPLTAHPAFQARLRSWSEAGAEIFLHGWFHRDDAQHQGLTGLRARHMTAGEGEFLGLDANAATRRMIAGRHLLEDITGSPIAGFVAPAWLYGPGAYAALRQTAMPLAEDHFRVWSPQNGAVLARGPVITWATRSTPRLLSSLAFAAVARHALKPMRVVRVATHPGDVTSEATVASIEATLDALLPGRAVASYGDLLDGQRTASGRDIGSPALSVRY
jgi:predicted deacetylase